MSGPAERGKATRNQHSRVDVGVHRGLRLFDDEHLEPLRIIVTFIVSFEHAHRAQVRLVRAGLDHRARRPLRPAELQSPALIDGGKSLTQATGRVPPHRHVPAAAVRAPPAALSTKLRHSKTRPTFPVTSRSSGSFYAECWPRPV
jgi:hypothetical protein